MRSLELRIPPLAVVALAPFVMWLVAAFTPAREHSRHGLAQSFTPTSAKSAAGCDTHTRLVHRVAPFSCRTL